MKGTTKHTRAIKTSSQIFLLGVNQKIPNKKFCFGLSSGNQIETS